MSEFARGVVGVFAVGMVVGVGALLLIPQSAPSAMRFADSPATPCSKQVWPATDRACQKWTAPRRGDARPGGAGKSGDGASLETAPESATVSQPSGAQGDEQRVGGRSAQGGHAAQRRKMRSL
jgi:hypothetical protein